MTICSPCERDLAGGETAVLLPEGRTEATGLIPQPVTFELRVYLGSEGLK